MSRTKRERPKHLAEKLHAIRKRLGLSQNELIERMGRTKPFSQDYISAFERDIREPPYPVLLQYAEIAGVCTDVLIDDRLKLPTKLPSKPRSKARHVTKKQR